MGSTTQEESLQVQPGSGFTIESVSSEVVKGQAPAVLSSRSDRVLYRLDDHGIPIVSKVGMVQLVHESRGHYYANLLKTRRRAAEKRGHFDTDNWGDIDTFRALGKIVFDWQRKYPDGPRLGIEDISSEFGGFPDYDGDGVSDHRTHQLGSHVNFLLPCKTVPEVEVFFGRRNEDSYDERAGQDLAVDLLLHGAECLTTTSATGLMKNPADFPLTHRLVRTTSTGTLVYRIGDKQTIQLMKHPEDHGNHVNAQLTPTW